MLRQIYHYRDDFRLSRRKPRRSVALEERLDTKSPSR